MRNATVFRAEQSIPIAGAVNSRGDIVVAGVFQAPIRRGIFVRSRVGFRGRWSPLVRLDSSARSLGPVVAIAESGDGAAAWVSGDRVFAARRLPNGRWGRTFRIGIRRDPGFNGGTVLLAVARSGRVTVVWQTTPPGGRPLARVVARTQPRRSARWRGPPPLAITPGDRPALGPNGVAAVATVDRAAIRVRRLEPGAPEWSPPIDVNANGTVWPVVGYDAQRPARGEVAVSRTGEIAVVWPSVGGAAVARARRGRPFVETPPIDAADTPSIRFVGTATLMAVSSTFSDPPRVFASVQPGAATPWSPRRLVAGGIPQSGNASATILGTAIPRIAWNVHIGPGDEESGIAEFTGGGWRDMRGATLVSGYGPAVIATSAANLILVVNSVVDGDGNWLTQSFGGVAPSRPAPRIRATLVRRSRSIVDMDVALLAPAVVWVRLQGASGGLTYLAPRRLPAGRSHIPIPAPMGRFAIATAVACDAALGCTEAPVEVSEV
ncbi:MAG: hypothetical protein HYX33_00960 [Actinobacteria bacterium]|nr:hypothetical protein [Actinomycetota bacterium]